MSCPRCNSEEEIIRDSKDTIHNKGVYCVGCDRWLRWLPKEDSEQRKIVSKYDLRSIMNFYKIKNPYCFFCNRTESQLGLNETLTRDHILQLNFGGKDVLWNLQILCTACHKMKNWMITYILNHLFGGHKGKYD